MSTVDEYDIWKEKQLCFEENGLKQWWAEKHNDGRITIHRAGKIEPGKIESIAQTITIEAKSPIEAYNEAVKIFKK